ncbi:hypothetical protein GCM10010428_70150 [Actinosynnema pretiosum subsp. pretiosum]
MGCPVRWLLRALRGLGARCAARDAREEAVRRAPLHPPVAPSRPVRWWLVRVVSAGPERVVGEGSLGAVSPFGVVGSNGLPPPRRRMRRAAGPEIADSARR